MAVPDYEDDFFICKSSTHEDVIFSALYKAGTDELTYFNMTMGKYYIENVYARNKTNILIKVEHSDHYTPLLFLPLVHFELGDFASIKKKLQLIVMMY